MKRNRWIVISIVVINIFIICGCIFLMMKEDNTAPEFRFQPSDYTYLRSDGEQLLLQNIMAYDNQDGDITDRIVIEKIVENQDGNTVVVYYAVSDIAGNVAKVSRIFPMEPSDEVPEYVTERQDEVDTEDSEVSDEAEAEEDEQKDDESEEDADSEDVESQEDEADEEDEKTENEAEEDDDNEEAKQEEPEPSKPTVDKSGHPVLTLKKREVTIQEGTSPPWTEMIETLRDDKDDYTTLYYNLHISKFTSAKAGDYPVTLQAEDSDGNLSDPVTVTVHVRGE